MLGRRRHRVGGPGPSTAPEFAKSGRHGPGNRHTALTLRPARPAVQPAPLAHVRCLAAGPDPDPVRGLERRRQGDLELPPAGHREPARLRPPRRPLPRRQGRHRPDRLQGTRRLARGRGQPGADRGLDQEGPRAEGRGQRREPVRRGRPPDARTAGSGSPRSTTRRARTTSSPATSRTSRRRRSPPAATRSRSSTAGPAPRSFASKTARDPRRASASSPRRSCCCSRSDRWWRRPSR